MHVASYVTGQGGGSLDGVRGAAMLSGFYRVPLDERGDLERVYYGDTQAEDTDTLDALTRAEIPLLFSVAERDPLFFQTQAARLVAAWFIAHRSTPNLVWVMPATTTFPVSARSAWTTPPSARRSPASSPA